uniref:Reverse transcriptase domain-containing protein n=1 Tax=Megaselia scalaris TaxID=36166 RepID=T1GMH5_MEGSC
MKNGDESRMTPQQKPLVFNSEEVRSAIQKLKNNKSTGSDGIPAELLKSANHKFHRCLSLAANKLNDITKASLRLVLLANVWKEFKKVSIPKVGKVGHSNAKDDIPTNC